jgi:hypothetical protein
MRAADSSPAKIIASASCGERNRWSRFNPFELLDLRPHASLKRPIWLLDRVVVALDPEQ